MSIQKPTPILLFISFLYELLIINDLGILKVRFFYNQSNDTVD